MIATPINTTNSRFAFALMLGGAHRQTTINAAAGASAITMASQPNMLMCICAISVDRLS
jgi:hypothetical protein